MSANGYMRWSIAESNFLRLAARSGMKYAAIALRLTRVNGRKRTEAMVRCRARRMRLPKRRPGWLKDVA